MLTSTTKRYSLPFTNQKTSASEAEAAAVFAVAEFARNRGGGLIARQPQEKLVYLSKAGYPLWLFPKNDTAYVFDGFADSNFNVCYLETPSAKTFIENLDANTNPREKYEAFLVDHGNYFQQSQKEKQFTLKGLIANADFKNEFNIYRKEASETVHANTALLSPTLDENTVASTISEFDKLQTLIKEESERLPECIRLVNKKTSQYVTELNYEASAATEELDAKIRAQEELVTPKITKLNKDYRAKIKSLTVNFDKEIERFQKQKIKTQKAIVSNEEKTKLYRREAKTQAEQKHKIYEKRWKEKSKQTQKELSSLKKELKKLEADLKRLSKQKMQEISNLNFALDAEVKFARQPLLQLEIARDAKILAFKQETDRLLKREKPVIEGIDKSIKQREDVKADFDELGTRDRGLKGSALFYIPFYVACYEVGGARRYLMIPPSTVGTVDFSSKLKGALGMSKIRDRFTPRFKTVASLIDRVQEFTKQNSMFETQLGSLIQKNNLLNNGLFLESVEKGFLYLKREGWLSEKEHQVLSSRLSN